MLVHDPKEAREQPGFLLPVDKFRLADAMRLVEGGDEVEEPAAAGATHVAPVEIRCWLTMSQLADLKSRLGIACGKAVDLAVRQGFAGSVAGDDALGPPCTCASPRACRTS